MSGLTSYQNFKYKKADSITIKYCNDIYHLDALARNILGRQCLLEILISQSEDTAGNNHSKSDGYK
jgi:hypothetical protein